MILRRPLNIFIPHCSDLLTDHRPHGDGLIAHGFIRHLSERGHNLFVAAQEVDLRTPLPPNVQVFPIGAQGKHELVSRLLYMWQVRKLFMRLRKRIAFDVIHQMNPVYTGISLSLFRTGVPVILGTYVARWPDCVDQDGDRSLGSQVGSKVASVFRASVAALQQRVADHLLLTAPAAVNRLAPTGRRRVASSYLAHGIDTELFSPEPVGKENKPLSVLFLGSIAKKKGIFNLISAFADVASAYPDCILYVAGSGPDAESARHWAQHLGMSKHIKFLGHIDRLSAPELYRNCSIYCLPSQGEPFATTVIEAMSCGKPVVFTNAGGLPHMIGAGGGIGVRVGDVKELSHALCCLLADPARRKAMGEHNRRRVLETMTWDHIISRLEEVYIATIAGNRSEGGERVARTTILAQSPEDCA